MQVYRIDRDGFFVEPVILKRQYDDGQNPLPYEIPSDCVEASAPSGFYKPKWDGTEWIEGATQEYINQLKANAPESPPSAQELAQRIANTENSLLSVMDMMASKGGV